MLAWSVLKENAPTSLANACYDLSPGHIEERVTKHDSRWFVRVNRHLSGVPRALATNPIFV